MWYAQAACMEGGRPARGELSQGMPPPCFGTLCQHCFESGASSLPMCSHAANARRASRRTLFTIPLCHRRVEAMWRWDAAEGGEFILLDTLIHLAEVAEEIVPSRIAKCSLPDAAAHGGARVLGLRPSSWVSGNRNFEDRDGAVARAEVL